MNAATDFTLTVQGKGCHGAPPEQAVMMQESSLGADDFAFCSDRVPGCYFNVGARTQDLPGQALHSPTFVPHEASMETAIALLTAAALACLS